MGRKGDKTDVGAPKGSGSESAAGGQATRGKRADALLGWMSSSQYAPYLFLLPFFVIFAGFLLYPLVYALVLSFSEWSTSGMDFVGFANYTSLFTDELFWKSLFNTGVFLAVQVPIMLFLAAVLAVQIDSDRIRFRNLFRLAIFFPVLIDLVTYALVFSLLFAERNGLVNQVLEFLGIGAIPWQTNGFWAKAMVIIAITWRWTGYNTIIVLAGLQSIPKDVYEAARVDGAGTVATFFRITVPLLKPVLLFCAIVSTIGTIQLFNEPYILTRGGPNNETLTGLYYLYDRAFGAFNFGLAAAGTYVLTAIVAIFAYIQIRVTRGGEI